MKTNLIRFQGSVLLIVGLFTLSGCRTAHSPPVVSPPQTLSVSDMDFQTIDDLMRGLREMGPAYAAALDAGEVRRDGEIPPGFWSGPIKALNPIKVYKDQGNIVIVQTITNGFEYGKYITPGTSSHVAGGDFYLTRTRGAVSDYRKRITTDVFWEQNEHYFKPKF